MRALFYEKTPIFRFETLIYKHYKRIEKQDWYSIISCNVLPGQPYYFINKLNQNNYEGEINDKYTIKLFTR